MKHNILIYCLLTLCFTGILISCNDETIFNEVEETTDRLFRPPLLEVNINGNKVEFKWIPIKNATFMLELSKDSLSFSNEKKSFEVSGTNNLRVDDLWSNTRYSARIKAVSKDAAVKDSEFQEVTFVTGTENVFYGISNGQITQNSILLKWNPEKEVTRIEVLLGSALEQTVNLTSSEVNLGERLIDGLSKNNEYTFKIYWGEMLRGTISIKTRS